MKIKLLLKDNTMKKNITRIIVICIFCIFSTLIFATPVPVLAATKPGIKPGNFLYFFDTAFEKINLFFTFSPEKKAQKALEYADERLAEAEALTGEKDTNAVKTAVTGYESSIALAAEESKRIKDKGKAEGLLASIADSTSKHQEILSDVLSKVPDEAKEAIMKAIEASKNGQEEATKQISELRGEVEQLKKEVADLKQEKQSQQVTEIEKLKKQVEELKDDASTQKNPVQSQQYSQPENVPQPQNLIQKPTVSDNDIKSVDNDLKGLILDLKERINIFTASKLDVDSFVTTISNEMAKYSNSYSVQQKGQVLKNNILNMSSTCTKLIEIENGLIQKLNSYIGSGKLPTSEAISDLTSQYNLYYAQYNQIDSKIKSSMEEFVLAEKGALQEELATEQKYLDDLKKIIAQKATETDGQLAQLNQQIDAVNEKIKNEQNRIGSKESVALRVNKIKNEELYPLLSQRDSLLGKSTPINYQSNIYYMEPSGGGGYTIFDSSGSTYLNVSPNGGGGYTIFGY